MEEKLILKIMSSILEIEEQNRKTIKEITKQNQILIKKLEQQNNLNNYKNNKKQNKFKKPRFKVKFSVTVNQGEYDWSKFSARDALYDKMPPSKMINSNETKTIMFNEEKKLNDIIEQKFEIIDLDDLFDIRYPDYIEINNIDIYNFNYKTKKYELIDSI